MMKKKRKSNKKQILIVKCQSMQGVSNGIFHSCYGSPSIGDLPLGRDTFSPINQTFSLLPSSWRFQLDFFFQFFSNSSIKISFYLNFSKKIIYLFYFYFYFNIQFIFIFSFFSHLKKNFFFFFFFFYVFSLIFFFYLEYMLLKNNQFPVNFE